MTFLAPALLFGLFAAAIPVIIHLLNRRRHRTIQWAAMQFLLKATRESRGKKRLKHLIILACRTLAIATLVFAVARPLISGLLGWGGGNVDSIILVLDRSASMESSTSGVPIREAVLNRVRESMQELGNPRLILLDSATGEPQDIPSPDVLTELDATQATDTQADVPSLISRAVDVIAEQSTGRTEIWVASDLQAADWRPDDERWNAARAGIASLPQQPVLRVLGLDPSKDTDVSIKVLAARRSGDDLLLELELSRSSTSQAGSLAVTITVNGVSTADTITLSGQSLRFQKSLPLGLGSDGGHGFVSLPADSNSRNNVSFFAYGSQQPARTWLVAEPGEAAEYLALGSAPPGLADREIQRLAPAEAHRINWDQAALVVWLAPLPQGVVAKSLTNYLKAGGHVMFFPPADDSAESFEGVSWGGLETAPKGEFFILKEWLRDDGPLRDGLDGTAIPAGRMKAIQRRTLVGGDSTPLATWDGGTSFLTRKFVDGGTAWFVNTTPDYAWSNLGDADVLLPLLQRTLDLGADRMGSAMMAAAGSRTAVPGPGELRSRLDDFSTNSGLHEAGVFRIGERVLAVNRPAGEDNEERVSGERMDVMLAGTNYSLFENAAGGDDDTLVQEIWRAFLIAMLLFLVAEAILCLNPKPAPGRQAVAERTPQPVS
jgi:hypothetical protein